jgi:hypothetical protein
VPTYERLPSFDADWNKLTGEQQERFRVAAREFVADLERREGFRPGLRVKRARGTRDVWEMTWAPNGRATWQYGAEFGSGEPHVIWRRVGTHDVFSAP